MSNKELNNLDDFELFASSTISPWSREQRIAFAAAMAERWLPVSLYSLLYRLEKRGWLTGRWIEKAGQRRRRFYRLTVEGKKVLAAQRNTWQEFVEAINRITSVEHA